jgi:hypothetical protein
MVWTGAFQEQSEELLNLWVHYSDILQSVECAFFVLAGRPIPLIGVNSLGCIRGHEDIRKADSRDARVHLSMPIFSHPEASTVELEPNHTHFVFGYCDSFTPTNSARSAARTMQVRVEEAYHSGDSSSSQPLAVLVVANGDYAALKAMLRFLRSGAHVLLLKGTGGLADEAAALLLLSEEETAAKGNCETQKFGNSPFWEGQLSESTNSLMTSSENGDHSGRVSRKQAKMSDLLDGYLRDQIHIIDIASGNAVSKIPPLLESLLEQSANSDPSMSETGSLPLEYTRSAEPIYRADYWGSVKLSSRRFAKFGVWRPTPTPADMFAWVLKQWHLKPPDFAIHLVGDEKHRWQDTIRSKAALETVLQKIALALQDLPDSWLIGTGFWQGLGDLLCAALLKEGSGRAKFPTLGICSYSTLSHFESLLGTRGTTVRFPAKPAKSSEYGSSDLDSHCARSPGESVTHLSVLGSFDRDANVHFCTELMELLRANMTTTITIMVSGDEVALDTILQQCSTGDATIMVVAGTGGCADLIASRVPGGWTALATSINTGSEINEHCPSWYSPEKHAEKLELIAASPNIVVVSDQSSDQDVRITMLQAYLSFRPNHSSLVGIPVLEYLAEKKKHLWSVQPRTADKPVPDLNDPDVACGEKQLRGTMLSVVHSLETSHNSIADEPMCELQKLLKALPGSSAGYATTEYEVPPLSMPLQQNQNDNGVHYFKLPSIPTHAQMLTILERLWNISSHPVMMRVIGKVDVSLIEGSRPVFEALVTSAKLSCAIVVTNGATKLPGSAASLVAKASEHAWLPMIGICPLYSGSAEIFEERLCGLEKYQKYSTLKGIGYKHTGVFLLDKCVCPESVHMLLQFTLNVKSILILCGGGSPELSVAVAQARSAASIIIFNGLGGLGDIIAQVWRAITPVDGVTSSSEGQTHFARVWADMSPQPNAAWQSSIFEIVQFGRIHVVDVFLDEMSASLPAHLTACIFNAAMGVHEASQSFCKQDTTPIGLISRIDHGTIKHCPRLELKKVKFDTVAKLFCYAADLKQHSWLRRLFRAFSCFSYSTPQSTPGSSSPISGINSNLLPRSTMRPVLRWSSPPLGEVEQTSGVADLCTLLIIHAVQAADMSLLRLLLQTFLSTGGVDAYGRTALHWAAIGTDDQIMAELLQFHRAEQPLKSVASLVMPMIDQADDFGCTALHYAVASKATASVKLLLEHGAVASSTGFIKLSPISNSINVDDVNEVVQRLWRTIPSEDPKLPVLNLIRIGRTDRRPIPFAYALKLLEQNVALTKGHTDDAVLCILELLVKHDATSTSLQLHEVLRFAHRHRQVQKQNSAAEEYQRSAQLQRYASGLWRCMLEVFSIKMPQQDSELFFESAELTYGAKLRFWPLAQVMWYIHKLRSAIGTLPPVREHGELARNLLLEMPDHSRNTPVDIAIKLKDSDFICDKHVNRYLLRKWRTGRRSTFFTQFVVYVVLLSLFVSSTIQHSSHGSAVPYYFAESIRATVVPEAAEGLDEFTWSFAHPMEYTEWVRERMIPALCEMDGAQVFLLYLVLPEACNI